MRAWGTWWVGWWGWGAGGWGGVERLCAAYKEINLFAVRYKGLLLEKDPHWLCIGD